MTSVQATSTLSRLACQSSSDWQLFGFSFHWFIYFWKNKWNYFARRREAGNCMILTVSPPIYAIRDRKEARRYSGLQQDSNQWPPRIPARCFTNWAISISFMGKIEPTKNDLAPIVGLHSSVGKASHRHPRRSWVRIPLKPWTSFGLLFPNCINWWAHGEDRAIACLFTFIMWRH